VRLADIQISEKDYRAALRSALVGIAHAPHDAAYRIMAADMLLFLERCGEARNQLHLVLADEGVSWEEKSTANTLLQKTQKHRHCRAHPAIAPSSARPASRAPFAARPETPDG
jgi:predicted Zn-dependent protease